MEEKNKKKLQFMGLFLLMGIFLVSSVSAEEIVNYSYHYEFDGIHLIQLKYEPYPVNTGEYFEVWFEAILGDNDYAKFELIEEFPFSLDSNEEAVRVYEDVANREVVMRYKVRVDKDAVEGNNELKLKYTSNKYSDSFVIKHFDISVDQVQTSFDAVIQEIADSEVSIAIANAGKNTANSVVVRIPEQEGFKATGTDGQMVGNLDAGDYSIVSFSLIPLAQGDSQKKSLKFDVHYTDTIGERRVVNMETSLKINSGGSDIPGSKKGMKSQEDKDNEDNFFTGILIIIGIVVIGLIVYFMLYKKYAKQKIKGLFSKNKSNNSSKAVPDWMKNAKNKEKKK